jgi:hypothetical protein
MAKHDQAEDEDQLHIWMSENVAALVNSDRVLKNRLAAQIPRTAPARHSVETNRNSEFAKRD